jgi:hypothetical protein
MAVASVVHATLRLFIDSFRLLLLLMLRSPSDTAAAPRQHAWRGYSAVVWSRRGVRCCLSHVLTP